MPTGVYRHYKGGYYLVLGIAGWSGNDTTPLGSPMVVYVSLTGAHMPGYRMHVRPLEEFNQAVQFNEGRWVPRFRYIGDVIPETARKALEDKEKQSA